MQVNNITKMRRVMEKNYENSWKIFERPQIGLAFKLGVEHES